MIFVEFSNKIIAISSVSITSSIGEIEEEVIKCTNSRPDLQQISSSFSLQIKNIAIDNQLFSTCTIIEIDLSVMDATLCSYLPKTSAPGTISKVLILVLINDDLHRHCRAKIHTERTGRINAEKSLRSGVIDKISDPKIGYPLLVIGKVSSPYISRRGTPRQGLLVPHSRSFLKFEEQIPTETLLGLDTYSHMLIFFLFHENTNLVKTVLSKNDGKDPKTEANTLNSRASSSKSSTFTNRVQSFASKVLPPLLNVFRSPHRPNAIGLSLVKIESISIDTRTIFFSGGDLVNGTPIFDIKPWIPVDCPTCIHKLIDHSSTNLCDDLTPRCEKFKTKIPDWVLSGLESPYSLLVYWKVKVKEDVKSFLSENVDIQSIDNIEIEKSEKIIDSPKSIHYLNGDSENVIRAISQMLSLDIRSVHRGRGGGPQASELVGERMKTLGLSNDQNFQNYEVEFDCFHVKFTVRKGFNEIVQSEYCEWVGGDEGCVWVSVDDISLLK